jgi:hypothetical protein
VLQGHPLRFVLISARVAHGARHHGAHLPGGLAWKSTPGWSWQIRITPALEMHRARGIHGAGFRGAVGRTGQCMRRRPTSKMHRGISNRPVCTETSAVRRLCSWRIHCRNKSCCARFSSPPPLLPAFSAGMRSRKSRPPQFRDLVPNELSSWPCRLRSPSKWRKDGAPPSVPIGSRGAYEFRTKT